MTNHPVAIVASVAASWGWLYLKVIELGPFIQYVAALLSSIFTLISLGILFVKMLQWLFRKVSTKSGKSS
jgi:hypothetical protein